MSLAHGYPLTMIPGPSIIPDQVLEAMRRPMPNIYEGEIVDTIYRLLDQLTPLARTEHRVYVSVSNGHGAWEMAISNTLSAGDEVLVLEVGRFATSWAEMAAKSGIRHEVLHAEPGAAIDPAAVSARLQEDTERKFKAILVAQVDTATSIHNDIEAIAAAVRAADHPALIMVDAVASLGCEPYEMDAWGVDVTVSGSQKGLMVPPGLGFVWAGERALEAHKSAGLRSGYWDWTARTDPDAHYWIFSGTPPVHHIWALEVALGMINEEGLENIWERHLVLSQAVHAAVDAWHKPDGLRLHVTEPAHRARSVTMVETGQIGDRTLRMTAETEAGLILGLGIHGDELGQFRLAHMGHVSAPMVLGALGTIESVLISMGAPMGASGVAAAAEVMGAKITPQASLGEGACVVCAEDGSCCG